MTFYVFSFNRGPFLRNCLQSVLDLAPGCPVVVVDDNSSDPETRAVLESLPAGVTLLQPPANRTGRHGGLYPNMQLALEHAESELVAFIQDDMQLVRPVDAADLASIKGFFERFAGCAFLSPCFLKGIRRRREHRITKQAEDTRFYFRHYPEKANFRGVYFAAVCIVHTGRLRAAGWKFVPGEIANAAQAQAHFDKMGFMADPIVMYLPNVPVYRGRKKTMAVRAAHRILGTAPKVFRPLTPEQTAALRARDPAILPFAEDYLDCVDPRVKKPYHYSAVSALPVLHALNKLELLVARLFKR